MMNKNPLLASRCVSNKRHLNNDIFYKIQFLQTHFSFFCVIFFWMKYRKIKSVIGAMIYFFKNIQRNISSANFHSLD